ERAQVAGGLLRPVRLPGVRGEDLRLGTRERWGDDLLPQLLLEAAVAGALQRPGHPRVAPRPPGEGDRLRRVVVVAGHRLIALEERLRRVLVTGSGLLFQLRTALGERAREAVGPGLVSVLHLPP